MTSCKAGTQRMQSFPATRRTHAVNRIPVIPVPWRFRHRRPVSRCCRRSPCRRSSCTPPLRPRAVEWQLSNQPKWNSGPNPVSRDRRPDSKCAAVAVGDGCTLNSRFGPHCSHPGADILSRLAPASKVLPTLTAHATCPSRMAAVPRDQLALSTHRSHPRSFWRATGRRDASVSRTQQRLVEGSESVAGKVTWECGSGRAVAVRRLPTAHGLTR